MRYSANLNIILKSIEKAAARISRDFMELENLQNNQASAAKFTNACYNKVKQVLAEDLSKSRPEYNFIFADGEKYIAKKDAEYSYTILPIDGLINLSRSDPHFTVAVALEHIDADGVRESISVAINNVGGNEIYYCEKGFGAYANNRRLRVSKRSVSDSFIIAAEDFDLIKKDEDIQNKVKNLLTRNYGCKSLEVAYLAAARLDAVLCSNVNYELLKPFMLLAKEAGGKIMEGEKFILASNGLIDLGN